MKKGNIFIITSLALILLFSVVFLIFIKNTTSPQNTVRITQNGKVIHTIPLNEITEATTITLKDDDNHYNIIEVTPKGIRIIKANCPDQLCVQTSYVTSLTPAVCLPHKLIIEVVQNPLSDVDALTQ